MLLVDDYGLLMALRVVAALSAAVVLPTALAAASTEAPTERKGRYLATVMTGLTGAILIGVPAGTRIGASLGREATFAFGGLLGLGSLLLAGLLALSGIVGVLGTRAAGRLVDRLGPMRAFVAAGALFCAAMTAFAMLWILKPVPVALAAALLACWSASAWAVPPSLQALMLVRAGERVATQALAVHSSSVYVGAALGGAFGGAVIVADPDGVGRRGAGPQPSRPPTSLRPFPLRRPIRLRPPHLTKN
ncbi:MFS transporter [Nocardiopsis gilva]|uniref:MFS transporter n=1 Tax=Nocardiopsis gilva TaxID=280236 RepID=UPI000349A97D|nr:MFS transporter [Nocardiopsis gilva]